jgi:alpha-N-arabinofuranosidase
MQNETVGSAQARPQVTIHADSLREPMSKYIYGQFIEHLGRCIYGGIWAEMIQDRKFYHAVGSEQSPWKIVGDPGAVEMVGEGSFVGEHTPMVHVSEVGSPCGIVQTGLGLVAGKEYVGRVILAGDAGAAPVDVTLICGTGSGDRQSVAVNCLTEEYQAHPIRFTAAAGTDDARLEIVGRGIGTFRIGTVSLMPADNVQGMRRDTLDLLKQLDAPIYRWPGGNFVSGYNWKDGLGDPDKRPPRWDRAWNALEPNDFGIHEFMRFCEALGAEPYIAVNSGEGDAASAAQEVEYANGAPDTPMGKLRARNGHRDPFNVKWWGIGNEMYGNWQLGHMPLADYVKKHNEFAAAMRAADPAIKLIAVGDAGPWSEEMLKQCSDQMDLISEHFYCPWHNDLRAHTDSVAASIRAKADWHREARKRIPVLAGKDIRIAMDEWNYGWHEPYEHGPLGMMYTLRDALGIAKGLSEYSRDTDIISMANFAQTVNVIAVVKTSKTQAAFDTIALPLVLYRHHFGVVPVDVTGAPDPLDVAVTWTKDRRALVVAVVNPTTDDCDLQFDLSGAAVTGSGHVWRMAGPEPMAMNRVGKEPQVRMMDQPVERIGDRLAAPALSVSLYELETK